MATKGILTKGAKFGIGHYSTPGDPTSNPPTSFVEIANILRMPSLGGEVEKVEVTTLADASHQYIPGLREYGDMEFTLLYDNSDTVANYRVLQSLGTEIVRCQVELGDKPIAGLHGTIFEFDAILTVSINEQEPNQALQFALRCALQSDISLVSNPL